MELKPATTGSWMPGRCPAEIAPGSARAILLFGPDEGGALEFARLALKGAGDVERFDISKTETADVAAVLGAASLFGGAGSVLLDGVDDRALKKIEILLDAPMEPEARLVIIAGDLKPTSKVRKLFSSRKDCVSAPLYTLRDRDIQSFAQGFFKAQGLGLSRDAARTISGSLSGDRAAAMRSCEIVALHTIGRGAKEVDIEDIRAVLDTVDEDGDSAPLDHALMGRGGEAVLALNRRLGSGESFVKLLRIFTSRAFRLRAMLETGLRPREAVQKAKPPVFWAERDQVAAMLGGLTLAKIDRILEILDRVEYEIIETGLPTEVVLPSRLLEISLHARWKEAA